MSTEPRRTAERRRTAVVQYNGVFYTRNFIALPAGALTERQVEGKFLGGHGDLADEIERSCSTVSRFFSGDNLSMDVTLRVLGALKLKFNQVHTPYVPQSDASDGDN
jgi:hypothetical protein